MTYEEAIKAFKSIADNEAYTDNFQDACKMAIEALEKQIPKKPAWARLGDSLSNADIITMCPCCYKGIEEDEHHCECGQAISWEE